MTNLYDDSWRGTLNTNRLQRYLATCDIDSVGGHKNVTPLAAACWKGHVDVVALLLDNPYKLANPNAPSLHNRTPLFYSVVHCPPANRAPIVRLLLEAGADVNAYFPCDGSNTSLMYAVTMRDREVVRLLVDSGASLAAKNDDGQTPQTLAMGTPMELLLNGSDESQYGSSLATSVIDIILAVVVLILTYTNSPTIRYMVNRIATKLNAVAGQTLEVVEDIPQPHICKICSTTVSKLKLNVTTSKKEISPAIRLTHDIPEPQPESNGAFGSSDEVVVESPRMKGSNEPMPFPRVPKESSDIPTSRTRTESFSSLRTFVQGSGLDKFFGGGSHFLRTVTEKATALREDPTTSLATPENIERLTRLSLYQLVIYCDDSGSMRVDGRYDSQRELVKRLARIATRIIPDDYGVELRFINANASSNLSAAQIEDAMLRTRPGGGTQIGTALRSKILQPLVYDVLDDPTKHLDRPLLVVVITDGHPEREPVLAFKDAIVECKQRLLRAGYEPTSVVFSISQIGNNEKAQEFLNELRRDVDLKDMLYCSSVLLDEEFRALQDNEGKLETWLLKLLTSPVMGRDNA